jgi:hypothetical protein
MSGSYLFISRNETVQPRYFHERTIIISLPYSHDHFAAAKYVARSWEYINYSQQYECKNWDWGHAIPFLEIHGIFVAVHALKSINSMISMHLRTLYLIQFCWKYIKASILGHKIIFSPLCELTMHPDRLYSVINLESKFSCLGPFQVFLQHQKTG